MATITLTIPDAVVNRVLDAIAATYNYNAATDGTKAAFAKKTIGAMVKGLVREHEAQLAQTAARNNTYTDVDTNVAIT